MSELKLSSDDFAPLVKEVVSEVVNQMTEMKHLVDGKLAISEPEAAKLLGLNPWQLRDLRLSGKIRHSRIVGNRIRYTLTDLLEYLRHNSQMGT